MNSVEFDWLAIAIASIVNVIISALWFNAPFLFAQAWLDSIGKSAEQVAEQASPLKPLSALIGAIITAIALSIIVSWSGAGNIIEGVAVGLLVAVGFSVIMPSVKDFFEGRTLKLTLLNASHDIVILGLMGAIIGGISG